MNDPGLHSLPDGARAGTIDVSAMVLRQLEELGRLRAIGMENIRALDRAADGLPPDEAIRRLSGRHGMICEFDRAARAVRQVIVLELELVGLRSGPDRDAADRDDDDAPDADREFPEPRGDRYGDRERPERDDSHDPSDYRRGPLDVVVAEIRKTLGAEAPDDDPFAPPPGRRTGAKSQAAGDALTSPPPGLPHRGGGTRGGNPSSSTEERQHEVVGRVRSAPSPKSALLRSAARMPTGLSGNRGPPDG